jgi:Family of unknown function (DUF6152)
LKASRLRLGRPTVDSDAIRRNNRGMKIIFATVAALVATCALALAHHSGVMFDPQKEVTLVGTVKEFVFSNPHVSMLISVTDEKNLVTDWSVEAASVQGMVQAGWRKSTLKVGDQVTIVGRALRDGRPGVQLLRAILADKTVLKPNAGANY